MSNLLVQIYINHYLPFCFFYLLPLFYSIDPLLFVVTFIIFTSIHTYSIAFSEKELKSATRLEKFVHFYLNITHDMIVN